MTEQEFGVIRAELQRLTTGLSRAIEQIVEQEAEINALRSVLERKKVASSHELELARSQAAKELGEILHAEVPSGPNRSNVVNMSRFHARRCRKSAGP